MGRRYYCDYCDRSFQDNMHNRKKHLNGVQHHRAKKAWFDHFRDSSAILHDEQTKKPCRKFLQKGICDFGPNCRFSHMSEEDLFNLKRQVEAWLMVIPVDLEFSFSIIYLCRGPKTKEDSEESQAESDIPQQLLSIPDLPPSLLPPPPGGWKVKVNTEWG
uniref:Zinc finger matrin-type protein 5 n=1 Tax=Dicentrarchus labrax TaxID=13489 RepID=A0A8P4K7S9_DICLA